MAVAGAPDAVPAGAAGGNAVGNDGWAWAGLCATMHATAADARVRWQATGVVGTPSTKGGVQCLITLHSEAPICPPIEHLLLRLQRPPLMLTRQMLSLRGAVFGTVAMEPTAEAHTWRTSFVRLWVCGELISPPPNLGQSALPTLLAKSPGAPA